jgi:hypothetical protein
MKIEFYTDTIKEKNEDIYGITDTGAYVIDGASALTDRSFTPGGNDVYWMGQWWKEYLNTHLDDLSLSIKDILKEGVRQFNQSFSQFVDLNTLAAHEQLSASIGVIRRKDDMLEVYVLGDIEISIQNTQGNCQTITDDSLKGLDDEVVQLIQNNYNERQKNIVFKGYTPQELDILIKNRQKMNTPEGYYILSHSVEAIGHGVEEVIPLEAINTCLLASDGIAPLDHKYSRIKLMTSIHQKGIEPIVKELRALEKSDQTQETIGRLRTHDDATFVYLDFSSDAS